MTPEEIETIRHDASLDQSFAGVKDLARFHAAYYLELRKLRIPPATAKEFTLQFIENTQDDSE